MNEEQRITKVEREKDPRRVEAGKRLDAISRAAKEKKAERQRSQERSQEQSQQERTEQICGEPTEDVCDEGYSAITILTGVGVLTGLVCLYFTYKQDKRAQASTESHDNTQPQPQKQLADQRPTNKLRSLDH